jgi:beta-glucanase (GH16 family)
MDYTSGFLGSRDADEPRYYPLFGRYEMRARVPHGQGLWPAFWLRHREGASVAEVDIMEVFHSRSPGQASSTLHLGGSHGRNLASGTTELGDGALRLGGWHEFSVEIMPAGTRGILYTFEVDGAGVTSYLDAKPDTRITGRPAQAWDIAVNLAVGGRWVGHPDRQPGYLPDLGICAQTGGRPPTGDASGCPRYGIKLGELRREAAHYEVDYIRVYVPRRV